jgi:xanthine dehydrogenase accessory factor
MTMQDDAVQDDDAGDAVRGGVRSELVIVRGGGDLATGCIWRLWRAGFPIVVCELAEPLTVRRSVAVSTAVTLGSVAIEGMPAERAHSPEDAVAIARRGTIAVIVAPELPPIERAVVVDARLAKRNLDTTIDDAPLVIGLGPGFEAGRDVHAVVETMRGPRLGRAVWSGAAAANTGIPGTIGSRGAERVLRAPVAGIVSWRVEIGDRVTAGQPLGHVAELVEDHVVAARFDGVVRGLIAPGTTVPAGLKIGDIDPRLDVECDEISDKALSVGGGVLEAVMTWISGRS